MSLMQHTIESPDGAQPAHPDRTIIGAVPGVANAVGSGAGVAVTTTVTLSPSANLPANYSVLVNTGQDATWYVTNKTSHTFDVVLTPRLAANTLAAGTFDCVLVA